MARTNNLTLYLTDVASAIKTKKGDTTPIKASDFDTEILNLPSGGDVSEYFDSEVYGENDRKSTDNISMSMTGWTQFVKKLPYDEIDIYANNFYCFFAYCLCENIPPIKLHPPTGNNMGYMFFGCTRLKQIPEIRNIPPTFAYALNNGFSYCEELTNVTLPVMKVSNITKCFKNCSKLTNVDFSNVSSDSAISFENLFENCSALETVNFGTLKPTSLNYAFRKCNNLTTLPTMDTSQCASYNYFIAECQSLTSLPLLDFSNVRAGGTVFSNSNSVGFPVLTDIAGLKDYGKAFTPVQTENYQSYILDVRKCRNLSHQSALNIINNLYDLNIIYNTAGGGTLYKQRVTFYTNLRDVITEEDLAIASGKGWNIVFSA